MEVENKPSLPSKSYEPSVTEAAVRSWQAGNSQHSNGGVVVSAFSVRVRFRRQSQCCQRRDWEIKLAVDTCHLLPALGSRNPLYRRFPSDPAFDHYSVYFSVIKQRCRNMSHPRTLLWMLA